MAQALSASLGSKRREESTAVPPWAAEVAAESAARNPARDKANPNIPIANCFMNTKRGEGVWDCQPFFRPDPRTISGIGS
jgi:hypothetical protein